MRNELFYEVTQFLLEKDHGENVRYSSSKLSLSNEEELCALDVRVRDTSIFTSPNWHIIRFFEFREIRSAKLGARLYFLA